MNWTCENEHKPTTIEGSLYCAKCGTKLGEADRHKPTILEINQIAALALHDDDDGEYD